MAQYGKYNSKNMGYGRCPKHAAINALQSHFINGNFGTVASHSERFNLMCDWLKNEHKITDLRKFTITHFEQYAKHIKQLMVNEKITVATGTNRVSTCNVVLKIMRGDTSVRIDKIGEILGQKRCYIRKKVPDGMCCEEVAALRQQLIDTDFTRAAAIVSFARACGMRLREAILADLPRLQREAKVDGKINIQDGTKGGRRGTFAPRWIPATEAVRAAIEYALKVSPRGSRNLLAPQESYKNFINKQVNTVRKTLHYKLIKGFHELRAAYACMRYEEITGYFAPVILKRNYLSEEERVIDRKAREIISYELGHGRIEVTNSYLGSSYR